MGTCWQYLLDPLNEGELEQIHTASLRILQDIGLRVHDATARKRLKQAGAVVREESGIVRLPKPLVDRALDMAPSEIMLYEASGSEMPCKPGKYYMGTQGYVPNFLDYKTRSWRTPGEQEAAGWARLADSLPGVRIVQPITQVATMSPLESGLRMARAVVLNTTKHYLAQPLSVTEAEVWFDLSQIVAQGHEARRKGLVTIMATCNSPLQLDAKNSDLLIFAAEHEIPVAFFGGPLAGATSPVTLAGTLALQNAEVLFGLVLSQSVRPGAPFFYGMASGCLDLRTGNALYAPIEYSLMKSATGQLTRFYKLPFYTALAMADSASLDVQNGIEKAFCVLITLMSGANFTSGSGNLATAAAAAYEQLVIDHEIYQMATRFMAGIEVSGDTLAWDAILRVGIGGHFMMDEHTLAWMRSGEHFLPQVVNREGINGRSMLERAHNIVTRTLSGHRTAVPEPVTEAVDAYVERRLSQPV